MAMRDHRIYEIDVTYTRTIQHRNSDDDVVGSEKIPNVGATHRVIAPKYDSGEEMAKAWVQARYQFDGGCKIVAVRQMEIGAFIELHGY